MQMTVQAIAAIVGGTIDGDTNVIVSQAATIETAEEGSLTFLGNPRYEPFIYTTKASAVLVSNDFQAKEKLKPTLIRVDDVYASLAVLQEKFQRQLSLPKNRAETAQISESAKLAESVRIGQFCTVDEDVEIGDNTIIYDQVYIGPAARIGKNVIIYPGVKILHEVRIGDNCIIHSNTVIGSDGFGFVPRKDGSYKKIVHTGTVIIEDDVEIGANCTIDRGSIGNTIIRRGVKMDNLIQLGHNVEIGINTVIAAQTGIAGSTKIGANCRIGCQVGFVGHIQIADGTQIQAQSGIGASITKPNTAIFGTPAIGYRDYIRSYAVFKKLPDIYRRLARMDKKSE